MTYTRSILAKILPLVAGAEYTFPQAPKRTG